MTLTCAVVIAASVLVVAPSRASAQNSNSLPKPTGVYPVGRRLLYVLDSDRVDSKAIRVDHRREFMAVAWYPAAGALNDAQGPWIPPLWADSAPGDLSLFTRRVQPPPTVTEIAGIVRTTRSFAHDSAPSARSAGPFPVVVFSPGNVVMPSYYATLAEELASHGYVVIGHVPTGYARAVVLPDGRVYPRGTFENIDLWIGDIRYLVDRLSTWNRDPRHPLYGILDTARIALAGHSGGANASEVVALSDGRVSALALVDPGLTDSSWATSKPTLILSSDWASRAMLDTAVADMLRERTAYRRHLRRGFSLTLQGAQHMSFTDLSAIPRLQLGPNGLAQLLAARRALLGFFDEALKGVRSALLRSGDVAAGLLPTPL